MVMVIMRWPALWKIPNLLSTFSMNASLKFSPVWGPPIGERAKPLLTGASPWAFEARPMQGSELKVASRTSRPPRQRSAAKAAQGAFQLIPTTPSKSLVKNLLGSTSRKLWNDEWQVVKTDRSTWNFFPTVVSAAILNKTETSYQLYQLLTGHCKLNSFLHRIKRSLSFNCTVCNSVEDVEHFLFYCTRFSTPRYLFKRAVERKKFAWPPPQPIFSDTSVLLNL
jgi:hypothetical protein